MGSGLAAPTHKANTTTTKVAVAAPQAGETEKRRRRRRKRKNSACHTPNEAHLNQANISPGETRRSILFSYKEDQTNKQVLASQEDETYQILSFFISSWVILKSVARQSIVRFSSALPSTDYLVQTGSLVVTQSTKVGQILSVITSFWS